MANVNIILVSRKEARECGLKHYRTGKPCRRLHNCERLTSSGQCVECQKQLRKEYVKRNKQRLNEASKKWYHNNKEKVKIWSKIYFEKNREAINSRQRKYAAEHREKKRAYNKRYKQLKAVTKDRTGMRVSKHNPAPDGMKWCSYHQKFEPIELFGSQRPQPHDKSGIRGSCKGGTSAMSVARIQARLKEDAEFKVGFYLRSRLRSAIRGKRTSKRAAGSFVGDLGCTIAELCAAIEVQFHSGMTWDNRGKIWQLDHIKPIAAFDLMDKAQFLEAAHYSNLQPLLLSDHREKSVKDLKVILENRKSQNTGDKLNAR